MERNTWTGSARTASINGPCRLPLFTIITREGQQTLGLEADECRCASLCSSPEFAVLAGFQEGAGGEILTTRRTRRGYSEVSISRGRSPHDRFSGLVGAEGRLFVRSINEFCVTKSRESCGELFASVVRGSVTLESVVPQSGRDLGGTATSRLES